MKKYSESQMMFAIYKGLVNGYNLREARKALSDGEVQDNVAQIRGYIDKLDSKCLIFGNTIETKGEAQCEVKNVSSEYKESGSSPRCEGRKGRNTQAITLFLLGALAAISAVNFAIHLYK